MNAAPLPAEPLSMGRVSYSAQPGASMFNYAVICLVISLIAGAIGMTNVSAIAKRLSMILFALFFLGFLALLAFAYLLGAAFNAGQQSMLLAATLTA
jgi:uncharacterized membrane protein YtjA (UPF0391 family)